VQQPLGGIRDLQYPPPSQSKSGNAATITGMHGLIDEANESHVGRGLPGDSAQPRIAHCGALRHAAPSHGALSAPDHVLYAEEECGPENTATVWEMMP
jgi:hypothetical protein